MFRLLFSVFHAKPNEIHKLQALPKSMTYPLVFLAFGSTTAGFLGVNEAYGGTSWINSFLNLPDLQVHLSPSIEYLLSGLNVLLALGGMLLAYKLFAKEAQEVKADTRFKKVIINKFYVDELYTFIIIKPLFSFSTLIAKVIDPKIFDGFINLNVSAYTKSSLLFAKLQNGKVRYYALYTLIGVSGMSLYMLLKLGLV
jgi:NADH-quinone oxidoreductase subunit L